MKRIALAFLALTMLALVVFGADLNAGKTFQNNVEYSASDFNEAFTGAEINTTFFTDKTATTSPSSSDVLLLFSVANSAFRKVTVNNLFLNNSALITGQAEEAAPVAGDYVLIYDASGASLAKAHLGNFWGATATNLINSLTAIATDIQLGSQLMIQNTHTNTKSTFSNFIYHGYSLVHWTNITALTNPTNTDSFLIHDASAGVNKLLSLASHDTNRTVATSVLPGDTLPYFSTNRQGVEKVAVHQLKTFVTNDSSLAFSNQIPKKFTTIDYALVAGPIANTNHGLPGNPQMVRWVLACVTADEGYAVGDEVDIQSFYHVGSGNSYFACGGNATNLFITCLDTALEIKVRNKGVGDTVDITESRWRARGHAVYFP